MEFSFFTTDNISGYKTTEKWFSKNHPDEYSKINEYCDKINLKFSFKEKVWFYFNKLTERPKCVSCGEDIKFRERFDKPYGDFCSLKCINENKEEMSNRQKKTFNKKYGVDFYPEHPDFVKKQKATKLERYGDENYNNLKQSKKTKKERYGDENYVNLPKAMITSMRKYGATNYAKSIEYFNRLKKDFKKLYPDIKFVNIDKFEVTIFCNDCKQKTTFSKQLLYERYKRNYVVCTNCNPAGQSSRSGYEKELSEFISKLGVNHETSNYSVLEKKEIDIYIPENKLGIEFDGLYWHNELFVTPDYHLNKTIECQKKGVELLHIFEDEWIHKKDIVKSILKNRLGKNDNTIYGRKCFIKEINSKHASDFLEKNHIQGSVNSKIRIGLYYEDILVSLMTFSKGRVIMGGKSDEWELNRFCNLIETNVIGSADKLFKYFIKKYHPQKVISYSDIRLFNGGLYEKLGFIKKHQSVPNYWYVINGMRYYRFNFRKSVLVKEGFDPNKTEKEIMFERKYYRIYDCGNIRWEYDLKTKLL